MITTQVFFLFLLSCLQQFIPSYCGSNELLDSWTKIKTNYANDIQQSNTIYNKIKEEQNALAELRTIVERHLRTKTAELLVNAVNSNINTSMPENNLIELIQQLDENYSKQMFESILAVAIDEIALSGQLTKLPDLLWNIYQQNDTKLFEIMLRAELQLYNSFGQKQHTDAKQFLHIFANKLYKITRQQLYNTLDLDLKLKVQNIIEKLPYNLKYLYFMPYFCLLNVKYSTYIYTAIEAKVDPLSRYIWLWHESRSMDDTGFIKAEVGDFHVQNDEMKLNVSLKGTKYQMYYYMMPNTMKIAGWDSSDAPLNYIWNIEFLDDDRVTFSQNNHLMCAVAKHDNDRRNVGGREIRRVSSKSAECQWSLGQCTFK